MLPEFLLTGVKVQGLPWIGPGLDAAMPRWFTEGMGINFYFGGTSLLIVVGVAMDTIQQVESQLVMRNYEGFLKKGRVRGRRDELTAACGSSCSEPRAAGKGTQAALLSRRLGIPAISTGELLREAVAARSANWASAWPGVLADGATGRRRPDGRGGAGAARARAMRPPDSCSTATRGRRRRPRRWTGCSPTRGTALDAVVLLEVPEDDAGAAGAGSRPRRTTTRR